MKELLKKITVAVAALAIVVGLGAPSFADSSVTQEVNTTLYKSGTTTPSMGNAAFAPGGTLTYHYDNNGNVANTEVVLNVTSVTYLGFITGYMTNLTLNGVPLTGEDLDGDGHFDQFKGEIPGQIQLNQPYVAQITINVWGWMNPKTEGDLVFTAK